MRTDLQRRAIALIYGFACHGLFLIAVGLMAFGLYTGMACGIGRLEGVSAVLVNGLLLIQFPILHSILLTRRGMKLLGRLAPSDLGRSLSPTTYALFAAIQIGTTFFLWSPSSITLWRPDGLAETLHIGCFVLAWAFLGKALLDAGLGLQTGWIGWTSAWSDRSPRYPNLPVRGLFRRSRQPIYLGFALVMWTGPVWTLDHLAIAIVWGSYCVIGPLLKERRFAVNYGNDFEVYRQEVPYFIPKLFS